MFHPCDNSSCFQEIIATDDVAFATHVISFPDRATTQTDIIPDLSLFHSVKMKLLQMCVCVCLIGSDSVSAKHGSVG